MASRFRIEFVNHTDRAIRMRTDIGDNVIPSGNAVKVSMLPASVVDVFDAGDQHERIVAVIDINNGAQ